MSQICPSSKPQGTVLELFEGSSRGYACSAAEEHSPLYQKHFGFCKKAILAAAEGLRGTALILGAGGCHDIPLAELAGQFDRITLVDFDLSLAEKALKSVSEVLRGKIEVHQADLTGIWGEFSTRAEALATSVPKEAFSDAILEILPGVISHRRNFDYPEKRANFVVSSLLSSQLPHYLTAYLTLLTKRVYDMPFSIPQEKVMAWGTTYSPLEENHMRDLHSWVDLTGRVCFIDHFFKTHQVIFKPLPGSSSQYLQASSKKNQLFNSIKVCETMRDLFQISHQTTWEWYLPRTGLIEGQSHLDRSYQMMSVFSHTLSPKKPV